MCFWLLAFLEIIFLKFEILKITTKNTLFYKSYHFFFNWTLYDKDGGIHGTFLQFPSDRSGGQDGLNLVTQKDPFTIGISRVISFLWSQILDQYNFSFVHVKYSHNFHLGSEFINFYLLYWIMATQGEIGYRGKMEYLRF